MSLTWWLPVVDGPLPVGDIIFYGGTAIIAIYVVTDEKINVQLSKHKSGNKNKGKTKSNKNAPTSQNQMQKQVERGKAPKSVDRVDKPHVEGQQPHIHFGENEAALNQDGTWHDEGMKSIPKLDNEIIKWIIENGWSLPHE